MIVLLDTQTGLCRVGIVIGDTAPIWYEWQADRQLAHGLLGFLCECLAGQGATFHDITGIGAYRGPGSFTGLRIGLTVANTLSDTLAVPIVGETDSEWAQNAILRLNRSENDNIVMPEYGAEAHITKPRK